MNLSKHLLYLEKVNTELKTDVVDLKKFTKAIAWSYQNDGCAFDASTNKLTTPINFSPESIKAYGAFIDKLFKQKFILVSPKPFNSGKDVRDYRSKNTLPKKTQNQKYLFWCKEDPYTNAQEMFDDLDKGIMIIYTGHSEHPFFDKKTNWKNRAVHDAFGHFVSDKDKSKRTHFNVLDELRAADNSIKKAPILARPIFFTEVIGQASNFAYNAKVFGTQKAFVLQGFDINNIGQMLPGYTIEDKWPFKVIKQKSETI